MSAGLSCNGSLAAAAAAVAATLSCACLADAVDGAAAVAASAAFAVAVGVAVSCSLPPRTSYNNLLKAKLSVLSHAAAAADQQQQQQPQARSSCSSACVYVCVCAFFFSSYTYCLALSLAHTRKTGQASKKINLTVYAQNEKNTLFRCLHLPFTVRLRFVSASPPLRLCFGFALVLFPPLLLFGFSISSCLRFGFWIFDFGLEYFEVASWACRGSWGEGKGS